MATRLMPKKSVHEKPTTRKASTKKASPATRAATNGPAASAEVNPVPEARKRLPAATIRALKELKAGKLNRYADADDMFQKLGIKLGQTKTEKPP